MPQTLARVLIHVVFSTKGRIPVLTPSLRAELYPYFATVLQSLDSPATAIGGVEDHVHLLFALSRTQALAKVVEKLKTSSSKWIKTKDATLAGFHWQAGYGAFSVSESAAPRVIAYIDGQEEHHRRRPFQDELRTLLRRHGLAFDERYLWD